MNNKILCSKKQLVFLGSSGTFHIQCFGNVLYSGLTFFCIKWFSKYPLGGFEEEVGKEVAQVKS